MFNALIAFPTVLRFKPIASERNRDLYTSSLVPIALPPLTLHLNGESVMPLMDTARVTEYGTSISKHYPIKRDNL